MSALSKKNADIAMRGSCFERVEGDRYWTEPWVTKALLDKVKFRGTVWEPACGRGDMVNVLAGYGYDVLKSDIAGDALGCKNASKADFLAQSSSPCHGPFSIVTNPPYTLAEAFIRQALELTEHYVGGVAMLLRNEYDCAAGRRELFEHEAFAAKLVLTRRPKWVDSGHSASPRHNFAWYVWEWGHDARRHARIEWLP